MKVESYKFFCHWHW